METVMSLIRFSLLSYRLTTVLNRHGAPPIIEHSLPHLKSVAAPFLDCVCGILRRNRRIPWQELIVIDIKGRVLVWRDYHGDVSVAQAQRFFSKLSGLGNILRQQHVASLWMLGGVLLVQLIFPKKQIAVSTQPRKAEKIHHMRRRVDRFKELMNA
ncbi:uncharacterized protein LOC106397387 [Brassica napus]|uniref:uncharacterized protein LOC106397387 n=1 Tax=Brassica napus TaxID=3708 RepID=UPI0006AA870B|nr:uncharacterized protein LOC106397387 [Brassica napus]